MKYDPLTCGIFRAQFLEDLDRKPIFRDLLNKRDEEIRKQLITDIKNGLIKINK
jgi:hypothetical protein